MNNKWSIIAGPCSAESYEQLRESAIQLRSIHPNWVRCGIWKPRSRPGGFQGAGEDGIIWILRVKDEFPELKFIVEVSSPNHVDIVLRNGIDAVWMGARTTTNPHSVNELASALRGTDLPVMVKNPMVPDLPLWIGAFERLMNSGVKQLFAIHRGFTTPYSGDLRNMPLWEIPFYLKKEIPELPIFFDPSHICGRADIIQSYIETAAKLDYSGIMVETHPQPTMALTDATQQITPQELGLILDGLDKLSADKNDNRFVQRTLIEERMRILDQELIRLNTERMKAIEIYKKLLGDAENLTITE